MASDAVARYGGDSPFPPITAVHTDQNEAFTLMYESSTSGEWNALAFITDRVIRRYERVEEFATVAAGDSVPFGKFGEDGFEGTVASPGDDRLRISTNHDRRIHEFSVGIEPMEEELLCGVETPSGKTVYGVEGDRERGFDAAALADFGGVASDDTFTSEGVPTTALSPHPSQGLIRIDSDENGNNPMRFGFQNNTGSQQTLNAEVFGAAYDVTLIESASVVKRMLYDPNVRTLTYGGQNNNSPNLPEQWQRQGVVTVSEEDALKNLP